MSAPARFYAVVIRTSGRISFPSIHSGSPADPGWIGEVSRIDSRNSWLWMCTCGASDDVPYLTRDLATQQLQYHRGHLPHAEWVDGRWIRP